MICGNCHIRGGESEWSRERKRKRGKKKSRHKKSRSKKSRKKHRKNDSFSESEDDRSRSEDTTKANVGNATTDSRKCSLDEFNSNNSDCHYISEQRWRELKRSLSMC